MQSAAVYMNNEINEITMATIVPFAHAFVLPYRVAFCSHIVFDSQNNV